MIGMKQNEKIFVAGHKGLVGSALVRALRRQGYDNLVFRTHAEMDLENQGAVFEFFEHERPDCVFLAAARVGGIYANNTYPADFIRSNLSIQGNVIEAARRSKVRKLMFLGSSCIYPRLAPQPMKEEYLLTGALEPTNAPYAVAKIAGIVTCQSYNRQFKTNFISVMPTNLYGPEDNFDLLTGHVPPAMIRKFHEAKVSGAASVPIWGTGKARREFLHADDMAEACLHLMKTYDSSEIINIGCGEDVSIGELAQMIRKVVGFQGAITFDPGKPDGMPRKLLDVSRLFKTGWRPRIGLEDGLASTYRWYVENESLIRQALGK